MNKFLKTYNLLKLNHEETESLNRHITNVKVESVIKNVPTIKSPGPEHIATEVYQIFKRELT